MAADRADTGAGSGAGLQFHGCLPLQRSEAAVKLSYTERR